MRRQGQVLHWIPGLRMRGSIPNSPTHFIVWCLIMGRKKSNSRVNTLFLSLSLYIYIYILLFNIMLNYTPNGRMRLGRSLKRLLGDAETSLLTSNWWRMTTTMMIFNINDGQKVTTQDLSGAERPFQVTFWPPDRVAIVLKLWEFNLNFKIRGGTWLSQTWSNTSLRQNQLST